MNTFLQKLHQQLNDASRHFVVNYPNETRNPIHFIIYFTTVNGPLNLHIFGSSYCKESVLEVMAKLLRARLGRLLAERFRIYLLRKDMIRRFFVFFFIPLIAHQNVTNRWSSSSRRYQYVPMSQEHKRKFQINWERNYWKVTFVEDM